MVRVIDEAKLVSMFSLDSSPFDADLRVGFFIVTAADVALTNPAHLSTPSKIV